MCTPGGDTELVERLTEIVRAAPSLMRVLRTTRTLGLPDWLVMSGAVYQRALNHLTGRVPDYGIRDYDLGYFDASDISYEAAEALERFVSPMFAVGVRLEADDGLHIEAPFGLADLFALRLRPNPRRPSRGFDRAAASVLRRWPEITIDAGA